MSVAQTSYDKECFKTYYCYCHNKWLSTKGAATCEAAAGPLRMVCVPEASVVKALIAYFPSLFRAEPWMGATSELQASWIRLSVTFNHHIPSSLPCSGPRLPVFLLFCGTSLPDSCCVWVGKPSQAVWTGQHQLHAPLLLDLAELTSWALGSTLHFTMLFSCQCIMPCH